jgi:hypothetical protein
LKAFRSELVGAGGMDRVKGFRLADFSLLREYCVLMATRRPNPAASVT